MATTCSIDGCTRNVRARAWCWPHYRRWQRYGDPVAVVPRPRRSVDERFWEKVDRSGGPDACWPWTASRDELGYGFFRVAHGENMRKAHRVAWLLTNGQMPDLLVCHRCDNPPCCNPAHLFLGTNADNMEDRNQKGRTTKGLRSPHHGEGSHLTKLTLEQVREIRSLYAAGGVSQAALGRRFGIGQTHVGRIVRGDRWSLDA